MKRLSLNEARELARKAVFATMQAYPRVPDSIREQLVLGCGPDGEHWSFELYIPADDPAKAVVLVEARVHRESGETNVTVFPERWSATSD